MSPTRLRSSSGNTASIFTRASSAAALIAGCGAAPPQPDDPFTATGQLIALSGGDGGAANACFTCHGLNGEGRGAAPRLAGLDAGYLLKQLEDYGTGRRADEVMRPIVRHLDEDDRRAVATWYAHLPAPAVAPEPGADPARVEGGRSLYHASAPGRPSCASCHGPTAHGRGLANPAIAGQPAVYTASQLRRWRSGERRNDPRGIMADVARPLSDADIQALAAYLASEPASPGGSSPGVMLGSTSSRFQK